MRGLLRICAAIDALNVGVNYFARWLVLAAILLSAGNAIVRKLFNYSANSLLEGQWYLFSAVFLLCAGYTLLRGEHVRIDIVASRLSRRSQVVVDILGTLFFLLPFTVAAIWLSWPQVVSKVLSGEVSSSAGGLPLWPAWVLIPVGFSLLGLQGVSEIIKRIAFLRGDGPDPLPTHASHN
ncbi:C4-dicarboxylate ABC transporter [Pleomorphomonas diazotrophica]|uniref:TRAP transporter small permease protein n=1 Tax=Pleomorphomonas diazotrophica TaxID=1166257 RepID=A0A1I4VVL9_9HYPH|nr:TRAP transporter small permease subunit [Pleomorphomonas diazotrophica]PKR89251.1 C4-dicarboxylate ABC transporter [Pleomorphomonas diazotrophica]SFN05242.1 TRAP-type mannitol/chloroaromatic compound transport system, small permease component [Pleomorphomonas diazotrophica]